MKVILVLDSYPPDLNGGAYFTHRLAKVLLAYDVDVKVACQSLSIKSYDDHYEGVPLRRFSSFTSIIYNNFRIVNPIGVRKKARAFLSEFKPDIVHLQGKFILGNAVFKEAKKMGIPCFTTNHLMPQNFEHYFKVPSIFKSLYNRFVWNWVFEMYCQLPLVVSPTQSGADELYKNGLKVPINVISCGVDCSLFEQKENPEVIRKIHGLPEGPIVLYTGRLDKEKNIDVVLRACEIALKKTHFHLVITGTGKEENKLKALAKKLGINEQVTFTGKIPDDQFTSIYSVAAVFVNACNFELQCISALEAIAAGLPVILSHSLALPELVNLEEPNGYTFTPNKYEELAEKLSTVLMDENLRKELSKNSLKLSKKHDIQNTALSYIETYKSMIKSSKR